MDEAQGGTTTSIGDDPTTKRALGILAGTLGCDVTALRPETNLVDDLHADEERLANVASRLELELGIDELHEDVDDWETVGDVLDSVHDLCDHRSRRQMDANAPKRPLSAYMFYSQDNRERVRRENPDVSFGQYGKILEKEWSEMSEQARAPYLKKAEDDKKRYETEKAHYDTQDGDE